jgi:peptidoglycan/xylan/chitin deacetylase (PgdA/CDA1 family)
MEQISDHYSWTVSSPETPTERHQVYRELFRLIHPLAYEEREPVLACLRARIDDVGLVRESHRPLTEEEIRQLTVSGLLEVGAHSVTHPSLRRQDAWTQCHELGESKRCLEEILGRPVKSFSYPYGGQADVGDITMKFVQDIEYEVACGNFPSVVTAGTNPFFLPRFLVRNWDGEELARRLTQWFHS